MSLSITTDVVRLRRHHQDPNRITPATYSDLTSFSFSTSSLPRPSALTEERDTQEGPAGVFPVLSRLKENHVADIKFAAKTVARCCAMGAAFSAYAGVPHLALVAALCNVSLSFLSDLCEKEIRERYERKMAKQIGELTSNLSSR